MYAYGMEFEIKNVCEKLNDKKKKIKKKKKSFWNLF